MRRRRIRTAGRWGLGAAIAASACVGFLTPIIWAVATSLKPPSEIYTYPPTFLPEHPTLANYGRTWEALDLPGLTVNTLVFAGGVTLLSLICDTLAAYAFARYEFRGKKVIFPLVMVCLFIPPQITLVPLYNLVTDMGLINTYAGLILPRAADAFGIFFLRQFFYSLPREMEDSARVDGAGEFRILATVMLPLARPAIISLALFVFVANWNELLWPLIMSTDGSLATLPSGLASFKGQKVVEYGPYMAGTVLAMAPMVVVFLIAQRSFVRSIAMTGIK